MIVAYITNVPGYGDQAHTLNIIRRLIAQYGFNGKLHLVYEEADKLITLLNLKNLPENESITLFSKELELEFSQVRQMQLTSSQYFQQHREEFDWADLGIVATDLCLTHLPDLLKAKQTLALGPPQFYPNTPYHYQSITTPELHPLNISLEKATLKIPRPSYLETMQYLNTHPSTINEVLKQLFTKEHHQELFRQFVYGMKSEALEYRILNLMLAGCRMVLEKKKPFVIQFGHALREKNIENLQRILSNESPYRIGCHNHIGDMHCQTLFRIQNRLAECRLNGTDFQLLTSIENTTPTIFRHLSSSAVIVIITKKLPQLPFQFSTFSQISPAVEGANSLNLLRENHYRERLIRLFFKGIHYPPEKKQKLTKTTEQQKLARETLLPYPIVHIKLWIEKKSFPLDPDEILYQFYSMQQETNRTENSPPSSQDMLDLALSQKLKQLLAALTINPDDALTESRCKAIKEGLPLPEEPTGITASPLCSDGTSILSQAIINNRFDIVESLLTEAQENNSSIIHYCISSIALLSPWSRLFPASPVEVRSKPNRYYDRTKQEYNLITNITAYILEQYKQLDTASKEDLKQLSKDNALKLLQLTIVANRNSEFLELITLHPDLLEGKTSLLRLANIANNKNAVAFLNGNDDYNYLEEGFNTARKSFIQSFTTDVTTHFARKLGLGSQKINWLRRSTNFFFMVGIERNWTSGLINLGVDYILTSRYFDSTTANHISTAITLGFCAFLYTQTGSLGGTATTIVSSYSGSVLGHQAFKFSRRLLHRER